MAQQKENDSATKKIPAKKHISVLIKNGRMVIDDHTHNDEYKLLLALFPAAGIKIDVQTESWCG